MATRTRLTQTAVILVGLAAYVGGSAWFGSTADVAVTLSSGDIGAGGVFVAFQLSPFVVLAALVRRLSMPGALAASVVFAALIVETQREVYASTSSTASIALVLAPLMLLFAVPVLLTGAEICRLVRVRLAGGAVARPREGTSRSRCSRRAWACSCS